MRGTRIAVQTVLEFLAAGDSTEDVLAEYPALTPRRCAGLPGLRLAPDGQSLHRRASGMKGFLLDQNLPGRLTFTPSLPILAATSLGSNPTDSELWEHARRTSLVIVSKDADFSDRIILHTPPPVGGAPCASATCAAGNTMHGCAWCGRKSRPCSNRTS
ncbi:MAG: DUF5615 family PIN-like protein [Lacunisphaera sp.]